MLEKTSILNNKWNFFKYLCQCWEFYIFLYVYLILENLLLWGKGGGHIKICDIRKFPRFTSLWICILRGKSNFSTPFQWFSQALGHIFLLLPFILVSPLHPKKLSKQQSFRLFSKSMRYRWQFVDGLQTQIKNLAAPLAIRFSPTFPKWMRIHASFACFFIFPMAYNRMQIAYLTMLHNNTT